MLGLSQVLVREQYLLSLLNNCAIKPFVTCHIGFVFEGGSHKWQSLPCLRGSGPLRQQFHGKRSNPRLAGAVVPGQLCCVNNACRCVPAYQPLTHGCSDIAPQHAACSHSTLQNSMPCREQRRIHGDGARAYQFRPLHGPGCQKRCRRAGFRGAPPGFPPDRAKGTTSTWRQQRLGEYCVSFTTGWFLREVVLVLLPGPVLCNTTRPICPLLPFSRHEDRIRMSWDVASVLP